MARFHALAVTRGTRFLAATVAVLAACSGGGATDSGGVDAAVDTPTAMDVPVEVAMDVAADVAPDGPSGIYGPCANATACGDGLTCNQSYPGGMCTQTCMRDLECAHGICSAGQCIPRCTVGGRECGPTQACDTPDFNFPNRYGCLPACSASSTSPVPPCNAGYSCNLYNLDGVCTAGPLPMTGGDDGAPCSVATDCKGYCIPEFDFDGAPTGYVQGMCVSFGRVPADSAYQAGQPYPQSNCPDGTVIVPLASNAHEGDVGACQHMCHSDSDCRLGYGCIFFQDASDAMSSTGFCDAINCLFSTFASQPNNRCPNNYTCEPQAIEADMPEGLCLMNQPDAGDASTDSAVNDVVPVD